MSDETFDLVVARYSEDLSWIGGAYDVSRFRKVFVYNKNPGKDLVIGNVPEDKLVVVQLENLGREAHTYITHIEQQYDNLASFTVFAPGSAFSTLEKTAILECVTRNTLDKKTMTFCGFSHVNTYDSMKNFRVDSYLSSNKENAAINPNATLTPSPERPGGKFFNAVYGEDGNSKDIRGTIRRGIFSASKGAIQSREKGWYTTVRERYLSVADPEAGHFFERTWAVMFKCNDSSCFKIVTPYIVKGFLKKWWWVIVLAAAAVLAIVVFVTVFLLRRSRRQGALPEP